MKKPLIRAASPVAVFAKTETEGVELVTVKDVEIVSTGTYPLAGNQYGNETTFTQDDLQGAIDAYNDPTVPAPRLKLGHDFDWMDGEPAFGKATNLRLSDDGQTILGDYVDVPKWLADIMPSAYPSRSMEGGFNVEVPSGKKYRMVITAVALLGVSLPGVTSLEDLTDLYGSNEPEGVEVSAMKDKITAALGRKPKAEITAMAEEDIKRAYYEGLDADQQWWWIRSTYIEDPSYFIVDDDAGGLYRVEFNVSGSKVEFSEPTPVKVKYVNASSADVPVTTYASRSESRPESEDEEDTVDSKEIRERLGLPEDASDEDVRSKLDAVAADNGNGEGDGAGDDGADDGDEAGDGDDTGDGEAEGEGAETPEPEAVAAGTVTVDREEFDRVKAAAESGAQVAATLAEKDRDDTINAAIKAGKFARSRRDHYVKLWASDADGTRELIASLEPGLVPVEETGESPSDEDLQAGSEAYPASWLSPQERKIAAGEVPDQTIIKEVA